LRPGSGFNGALRGWRQRAKKSKEIQNGQLAQLVEQRIENPRVLGSIPRLATSIQNGPQRCGPFFIG
jgi:hypothetical protein